MVASLEALNCCWCPYLVSESKSGGSVVELNFDLLSRLILCVEVGKGFRRLKAKGTRLNMMLKLKNNDDLAQSNLTYVCKRGCSELGAVYEISAVIHYVIFEGSKGLNRPQVNFLTQTTQFY